MDEDKKQKLLREKLSEYLEELSPVQLVALYNADKYKNNDYDNIFWDMSEINDGLQRYSALELLQMDASYFSIDDNYYQIDIYDWITSYSDETAKDYILDDCVKSNLIESLINNPYDSNLPTSFRVDYNNIFEEIEENAEAE